MNILLVISEIVLRAPIWRSRGLLPAVFGIALLFPPQFLHAQTRQVNQITICNSGNTRLSVARVTNACSFGFTFDWNARWFAEGWYYVEPGECENLLRSESGFFGAEDCSGYYYFAFRITGKNGTGMMRYKADPGTDFFGFQKRMDGMENIDKSFCVKIADGFAREGPRSSMDDCPSGWELVPFSIGMSVPWNGGKFKLTINADRSSEVELFTTAKPPDEKTLAAVKEHRSTLPLDEKTLAAVKEHRSTLPLTMHTFWAAQGGDADAQHRFGDLYLHVQDYTEARKWYRKAAEQGLAMAQYNLGVLYYYGQGGPQDYTEARKWYRKAGELGVGDAQFRLGFLYHNGQGGPKDYTEARKWYRKAGELGYATAQYSLGVLYHYGQGGPQDYTETRKWYRKAGELGYATAQYHLGLLYYFGLGGPKDFKQAYAWFDVAATQGHEGAKETRGLAEAKLDPASLAEARKLSKQYHKKQKGLKEPDKELENGARARTTTTIGQQSNLFDRIKNGDYVWSLVLPKGRQGDGSLFRRRPVAVNSGHK